MTVARANKLKFDNVILVETPEGTDLQAEPAGLVPRSLAFTLDFAIRLIIFLVASLVLRWMGGLGEGILLMLFFSLEWLYPVVFEVWRGGQTPGKKALKLVVINDDLTPIGLGASSIRNLLRTADFLPLFYFFGGVSMLTTKHFQRLGDLAAGTIVVYSEPSAFSVAPVSDVIAIACDLSLDEAQQQAFIRFTLSGNTLSVPRQTEIAEIARPMIPEQYADARRFVAGVGKWLLGSR